MNVLRRHAMGLACAACVLVIAAAVLFGIWIVGAVFCAAMMVMMVWMMVGMASGAATKHRH
ncbi:MAG TPA: hypothetical protein VLB47_03805 [Solirubrobacteraceae bacterium]|nr:hypothetical protein [Solirubrobacteraceae bacterium]